MIEISNANSLTEWLKDKPPEFASVMAAQIALRVAPILRDALCTNEAWYRARIVLPCFRALAAASFAGAWPDQFGNLSKVARNAARSAEKMMVETAYESQMNVVYSLEAVPEEYHYIHELENHREDIGVASHAVDAMVHAVQTASEMVDYNRGIAGSDAVLESVIATGNAAHRAVDGVNGYTELRSASEDDSDEEIESLRHTSEFWKVVERDAIHLERTEVQGSKTSAPVEDLSKSALWLNSIPTWASMRWAELRDALPDCEVWGVWTDWYEARLVGEPPEIRCWSLRG